MKKYIYKKVGKLLSAKTYIACIFLQTFCASSHAQQIYVVEEGTNAPIAYASVFDDATGKVLGMTTSNGAIPTKISTDATISIQHLNYHPITIKVGDIKNDSISMANRAYQVKEVAVNPQNHDYLRMKYYIRQYSILKGMVAEVAESICYAYYDFKDHSKKPRKQILSRRVLQNADALKGEKLALQGFATNNDPLMLVDINPEDLSKAVDTLAKHKVTEFKQQMMRNNAKLGTRIFRNDTINHHLEVIVDSGFVEKPMNIPLFGISLTNLYGLINIKTSNNKVKLTGLENFLVSCRAVHNKTQGYVDIYAEIYPIAADYADKKDLQETKNQAKENKKDFKDKRKTGEGTSFEYPSNANIPPFNKYVEAAIKNMTEPQDW